MAVDSSSPCQVVLTKMTDFYRIAMNDSDEKLKTAIQNILHLWPDVLVAAETATDDELFALNASRAVLTQIFAMVLSKEFFYKDTSLVRQIFFTLFNILVDHTDIFKYNHSTFIDSNLRLIIKMATSITSLVQFKDGDLSNLADYQLLIAIREHVDEACEYDHLTNEVISLIWNLSDRTILVPILLKADYGKSVVKWIETREGKFRDDKLNAPIHILHNLARHDDGIDQLNSHHTFEVIDKIKTDSNMCEDADDMAIHITMIRALLTNVDQIKSDSTTYSNESINKLVQLSINAAKNERYRYGGSHVSEPLTVLVKLSYNDDILRTILCHNETKSPSTTQSIIELFTSLLGKFYSKINPDSDLLENYTCVVIMNLFWLISNHPRHRQVLRNNEQLKNIVKNAANDEERFIDTCMPRTMKGIRQAANDILRNLNSENA